MTGIPDPVDIFEFYFQLFLKCLDNILVIKKEKKFEILNFFIYGSKNRGVTKCRKSTKFHW